MIDSIACALVKLVGGLLCRLPPGAAVWLGEQLGALAFHLQPKRVRIGVANLRAAFDGELTVGQARRIIRGCHRQLGAGILELLRLPVIDRAYVDRYVAFEGLERVDAAVTAGRPIIFLTGHYGSWELCSITGALQGYPIVALARAQDKLPKLYRLLVSYRESKGCTVVHKGGAMRQLIAALEQGRYVGIVGDQASRQGMFVNFFGRPALFATGPFELAHAKRAVILPVFIRRVRGPFHRLTVEPPIELSAQADKEEAVRRGVERFVDALERHVRAHPGQWLWMHRRWKHTPARRALVLSDGKLGHVKQSLAVVEALRECGGQVTHRVIEVRWRHRLWRTLAVLWSVGVPWGRGLVLRWALEPRAAMELLHRSADVIVSCGSAAVPANVLAAGYSQAKSVVLMNPSPLPLGRFDLIIAPRHDHLPSRPNVVQISGALSHVRHADLSEAAVRLENHPKFRRAAFGAPAAEDLEGGPTVALFLGGDTAHHRVDAAFVEAMLGHLLTACEAVDGRCLATTSRRTPPEAERLFAERLSQHPRCPLALLAGRDSIAGTMEGLLGAADVAVVTGESVSMVSEACASGRRVIVVEPPLRAGASLPERHRRFLQELAAEGYVVRSPLADLDTAVRRALEDRRPPKRLDDFSLVRAALKRLV